MADFFLVHAHVDGDPAKATVFLVDKDTPGVRLVRTPKYTHTFVFEHPIYAFEDVRVGPDRVLGEVGQGFDLTKDWFVEERLMIGARTVGAAQRCLDEALAFATERRQFGRAIADFQAIEFMLADSAVEIMAAKSMLYRVCWEAARGGLDRKQLHAEASAVKLYCSETAGPCRRPRGADLRRPWLHARVPGRADVARAPRGPDLGGHLGDPAHRGRQRAAQARTGRVRGLARLVVPRNGLAEMQPRAPGASVAGGRPTTHTAASVRGDSCDIRARVWASWSPWVFSP